MENKIYTKKGDKGETQLLSGQKVNKYNIRLEAYGNIDELNSWIGMIRSYDTSENMEKVLVKIQRALFSLSSNLAFDDNDAIFERSVLPEIDENIINLLEKEIDRMNNELPELKNFIIPGGEPQVSACHLSRTVCRRAERRIVQLSELSEINPVIIKFINRLSDYFFILSRYISYNKNIIEINWKKDN